MAGIDQHISITISIKNTGIARAGFGLAMILSYSSVIAPDFTRLYSDPSDMVNDGFAEDSPEVLGAEAQFDQTPHVTGVLIGRGTNIPTLKYQVSANQVVNSAAYGVNVTGEGVTPSSPSITSAADATLQEIHNDLLTALNAVVGANYTAAFAPLASLTAKNFTADHTTPALTSAAHGWNTGDGPLQLSEVGGALPTGLAAATNYWVIKLTANTFLLASTLANALAGTAVAFSDNGSGTLTATPQGACLSPILPFFVTANAAGDYFTLEAVKLRYVRIAIVNVDPGVQADLTNILTEDNTWYAIVTPMLSSAIALEVAAWTESNGAHVYFLDLNESDSVNTSVTDATDTLAQLLALGYKRTLYSFHHSQAEQMSSAWLGVLLPKTPGTWNAKFKSLAGVTVTKLDDTQRANLIARRGNAYTNDGVPMTWEGTVANLVYGFIDVVDSLDWWFNAAQTNVLGVLVGHDKIGYDDHDIAMVGGAIEASLHDGVESTVFAPGTPGDPNDPAPEVDVPLVASIDPSVRALRELPDINASARLDGSVNKVFINATFTF
jgi:hypothetical protein